jgi:hypothetical protein
MQSRLPITGTAELLATLSDFVPDEFINTCMQARSGRGRRHCFSAAQLCLPDREAYALRSLLPEQLNLGLEN